MNKKLKVLREALIDPSVPDRKVIHFFCEVVRTHPHSKVIIDALGLIYKHRSAYSSRKSGLARNVFRKILLPRIIRDKALTSSFYAMLINKYIPSICLIAVINAVKRQGKDYWLLVRLAIDAKPLFVDEIFTGYKNSVKTREVKRKQ